MSTPDKHSLDFLNSSPGNIAYFAYLDDLQWHLERIYEIYIPHCVSDFVLTDHYLASTLINGNCENVREQLLIRQNKEDLDISLYLHSDVIKNLPEAQSSANLNLKNMENLCLAIEGISHFLYLVWHATQQHKVTRLELELQAEIDKYILIMSLLKKQQEAGLIKQLRNILFENIKYDDALDMTELTRYQEANFYAAKYCQQIEYRFIEKFGSRQMFNELRCFYRLGQNAKLNRICNNRD